MYTKRPGLAQQIRDLFQQGYSKHKISQLLGCSVSTVFYHTRDLEPNADHDLLAHSRIKELEKQLRQTREAEALLAQIEQAISSHRPYSKPRRPKAQGKKSDTRLVLLFSDLHYGECVSEEETGQIGAYSPEIAKQRCRILVDKVATYLERTRAKEVAVFCLGDMVSGDIHEELQITNAEPLTQQALECGELIAETIGSIAEAAQTSCWAVVGNHGRMRRKPYWKQKQVFNMDWIAYKFAQRLLAQSVAFEVPSSPWCVVDIVGSRFLLIHGDQVKSWAGIPWYGLTREVLKRRVLGADVGQPFDHICMGHFHIPAVIPIQSSRCFVNGSVKGGDEYSLGALASASRPAQLLLEVSPTYGVIGCHEIYLD